MRQKVAFTPLHLTIFICCSVGQPEGYPASDVAADYERELVQEGLLWRNDIGYLHPTVFGECKMKELLMRLHSKGGEYL